MPILEEIFRFLDLFDSSSLKHVYRERNQLADTLSKAGTLLPFGEWHITEAVGEEVFEYYHMPFIEVMALP
jgi:hypothetical protein